MSLRRIGGVGRQLASYATVASRASIQPIAHAPGSGVRFGAVVQGVNIDKISGKEPWVDVHLICVWPPLVSHRLHSCISANDIKPQTPTLISSKKLCTGIKSSFSKHNMTPLPRHNTKSPSGSIPRRRPLTATERRSTQNDLSCIQTSRRSHISHRSK